MPVNSNNKAWEGFRTGEWRHLVNVRNFIQKNYTPYTLREYDFYNTQGSLYLTKTTDMLNLYKAMEALKRIEWFRKSVRDIRAFRVEDWSNFTSLFKE